MEDYKLINRKESYRKCKFTIMESRERYNLSLRKQTIEDYIFKRRIKSNSNTNSPFTLEINPDDLDLDYNYKNFFIKEIVNIRINIQENDIELVSQMLTSNDINYKKYAVYLLRVYLTNYDPLEKEEKIKILRLFNQFNVINILCEFLTEFKDAKMIFESYWVLINMPLIKLNPEIVEFNKLIEDNMIEAYTRHIGSEYGDIFENAIWHLCNIMQESHECRDKIIQSKIFGEVMKILRKDQNSADVIENSIWFLTCTMKLITTTPPKIKISECLEVFSAYIYVKEQRIICQCLWGIYYITQFDEMVPSIYKDIINSGSIVKIMKLNYNRYGLCLVPSIRILGNLCTGRYDIVDELLSFNILDFFDHLLSIAKEKVMLREIVWAISNISAGTVDQCRKVVESAAFDKIIEYLSDYDFKLKKEAVHVIHILASVTCLDITINIVDRGVLKRICEILEKEKNDVILVFALESVYNILYIGDCLKELEKENSFAKEFDKYGGNTLVENLQNHNDDKVYQFTQKILDTFYITQEV